MVPREDFAILRLQLASVVLNTAGGVLGSGTVQRKFKFSMVQRCV